MAFGRATYGRMGRLDVNPTGDDSHPEARPVDSLDGLTVNGMAAGESSPVRCLPSCLANVLQPQGC